MCVCVCVCVFVFWSQVCCVGVLVRIQMGLATSWPPQTVTTPITTLLTFAHLGHTNKHTHTHTHTKMQLPPHPPHSLVCVCVCVFPRGVDGATTHSSEVPVSPQLMHSEFCSPPSPVRHFPACSSKSRSHGNLGQGQRSAVGRLHLSHQTMCL